MSEVAEALGVDCSYCHQASDYSLMTHNKQVANWMAQKLAPSLRMKSDGSAVGCGDCHASGGRGVAKILGDPRSQSVALEWMTAHLTHNMEQASGEPLYCATCHEQTWGHPDFAHRLIPFRERGNDRVAAPSDGTKDDASTAPEASGAETRNGDTPDPKPRVSEPQANDKN